MSSLPCEIIMNFDQSNYHYELNIGYSRSDLSKVCFIIIPVLGAILNFVVIINFLLKKKNDKESK